ncbi:MAG: acyl-CoA desaturase [Nitriliruptoraceae bacterium]
MSQLTAPPTFLDETPTLRGIRIAEPGALLWQRVAMLLITIIPLVGVVAAVVALWGNGISGVDLGLLLGFYFFTGFGVTVGFHRLFTHKSFKAARSVRVVLAAAGSMGIQGSVNDWVAAHRRHHAYSDKTGDPHSPHVDSSGGSVGMLRGLWYAHLGWMFARDVTVQETWAPDLLRDPDMRRISAAFPWVVLVSFVAPAVLGGLITTSWIGALTGFLWGGLVRIFLLHHVTWSINSICHVFGTRPFDSHDEARNNAAMAVIGFGEGWHNAHHAFPSSARHGLRWWELDLSYLLIRGLALVRLARGIKVPSPAQIARRLRARQLDATA